MLTQIYIRANDDGTVSPRGITVYEVGDYTHPVNGRVTRSEEVASVVPPDALQRIADAINAELAGTAKETTRINATKAATQAQVGQ